MGAIGYNGGDGAAGAVGVAMGPGAGQWDDGSIAEGPQALALFTDRRELIRHFVGYLHGEARDSILILHGDGGNGKSLLLRYLRERGNKRIAEGRWTYYANWTDEQFVRRFEDEPGVALPWAHLDFGLTGGGNKPRDPLYGLLDLRRQLAAPGRPFYLFDFAVLLYERANGRLSRERLRELFPATEVNLLAELIDMLGGTAGGTLTKAVLELVNWRAVERLRESATIFMAARALDEGALRALLARDAKTELLPLLPRLFAEDLNAAMALPEAPARLILTFDTHEAFWGERRGRGTSEYAGRDAWLSALLHGIEPGLGIVAVVGGREVPHWAATWEGSSALDIRPVGELTAADAREYLDRAAGRFGEIAAALDGDPALVGVLLRHASVAEDRILPYHLGLCLDVIRAAARTGARLTASDFHDSTELDRRDDQLVDRLLRYADAGVRDAVYALAACRTFDQDLYYRLARELHFPANRADWLIVTSFSFVWREGDRYRLHNLLRALLHERDEAKLVEAHPALEAHYRQRSAAGEEAAQIEALYHAGCQDSLRGGREWVEAFEAAMRLSRYDHCRALLDLRTGMVVQEDFTRGLMAQTAGYYNSILALHTAAQEEYHTALAAYDRALHLAPDDSRMHNNRGNLLQAWGNLLATLGRGD